MNKILAHENIIFSVITLVILFYFWSILGSSYTPVNDAWASIYWVEFFETKSNWYENPRLFRMVPFWTATLFSDEGFLTINVFLFLINFFTSITTFLLLKRVFHSSLLFSAVAALFITYFPYDGTMFWLGAFGVNLGLLFALLAIYCFVHAVQEKSWAIFIISCLVLTASFRTYPGYIPFLLAVIAIFFLIERRSWRNWWPKACMFLGAWVINFSIIISEMSSEKARESKLVDLSITDVLRGVYHAFYHLYVGIFEKLVSIPRDYLDFGFYVVVITTVTGLCLLAYKKIDNVNSESMVNAYTKIALNMLWVSPIILIAGYAPYAISELRFGVDRQFLFAKFGVAILLISLIFSLSYSLFRSHRNRKICVISLSVLILGSSIQSKAEYAEQYSDASKLERIFLGELAESFPRFSHEQNVLIFFSDDVGLNSKSRILINRPEYLLRHLYDDPDLNVVATNSYLWSRFKPVVKNETILYRNKEIPLQNLVALKYSSTSGFSRMEELIITTDEATQKVQLTAPTLIEQKLSDRQRWFIEQKNHLKTN